jgi:hypothetical protein
MFRHAKHINRERFLFVRCQVLFLCCLLPPRTTAVVAVPSCGRWKSIQVITTMCITYYLQCESATSSCRHRSHLWKSRSSRKTLKPPLGRERGA